LAKELIRRYNCIKAIILNKCQVYITIKFNVNAAVKEKKINILLPLWSL